MEKLKFGEEIGKEKNQIQIIKALAASLFVLIIINLASILQNPISAYQYSFFNFLPIYFWIFSICIFIIASGVLIGFQDIDPNYRTIFFFIILLNNGIILFSPYLGGAYLMSAGDLSTYGGMVLDLYSSHSINFNINFYPLMHLLCFSLSAIMGVDALTCVIFLSPIFSLLFPVFTYIISREITNNDLITTLVFLLSSTFIFSGIFPINSTTTPYGLSLLMLPIVFFCYIKTRKTDSNISYKICSLFCFSAVTIFHPLTGSLLFITLMLIIFLDYQFKFLKTNIHLIGFYFSLFLLYIIYLTKVWKKPLNFIYDVIEFGLNYATKSGFRVDIQQNLNKLDLDVIEIFKLFIKMFGHQFVFIFLTLIFCLFFFYKKDLIKKIFHNNWFIPIFAWTMISLITMGIQIVKPILIISFYRFLYASLVFTPIFVSIGVVLFSPKKWRSVISMLLVSLIFVNSILVVYPSPYISYANPQVTYADQSGPRWIYQNTEQTEIINGYFGAAITKRVISGLIPYSEYIEYKSDIQTIDDHLGYLKHRTIGEFLSGANILIISKYDIVAYTQVYKKIERLNLNDLNRLDYDPTASLIYNNKDYLAYKIII